MLLFFKKGATEIEFASLLYLSGNELSGKGIGASLTTKQYASDLKTLESLVNDVYSGSEVKPLIMAPGGFFDESWFKDFVDRANGNVQVVTHRIYNLGLGTEYSALVCLMEFLDSVGLHSLGFFIF